MGLWVVARLVQKARRARKLALAAASRTASQTKADLGRARAAFAETQHAADEYVPKPVHLSAVEVLESTLATQVMLLVLMLA